MCYHVCYGYNDVIICFSSSCVLIFIWYALRGKTSSSLKVCTIFSQSLVFYL
uniref:Uncharacterized protein n=1 Tax=Anguilla anguilla TaxID=7936 RepID=A0A0E9UVD8_ANGAN